MARVYVAGPMTGLPQHNYPAFHEAAAKYRAQGHDVVSPAELHANRPANATWSHYMRIDIAHLVTCDTLVLLPGWSNSRGANLERRIADALGMKIQGHS